MLRKLNRRTVLIGCIKIVAFLILTMGLIIPLQTSAASTTCTQDTRNPGRVHCTPISPMPGNCSASDSGQIMTCTGTPRGLQCGSGTTNFTCEGDPSTTAEKIAPGDTSGDFFGIGQLITNIVYIFTVGLGAGIAYIAAQFFNIAVYASLQSTAYALDFIAIGWTQVRDLTNLAFIFILVYVAFSIMLSANTREMSRTLAYVVVVALIINFSFFFTRVVIDAGNILAIQFYNAIETGTVADTTDQGGVVVGIVSDWLGPNPNAKDLTASIMNATGVQTILSKEAFDFATRNGEWVTPVITFSLVYLALGIALFLLAAVFLIVGIKFMIRIVILWLAIIAAPLALALWTMKGTEKYFKEWIRALITYTLYPAIFLFIFLIITNFSNGISSNAPNVSGANIDAVGQIISHVLIRLGFIFILLFLALKASATISAMSGSYAQNISRNIGGRVLSTTGFLGRRTLGAGAYAFSRSTAGRSMAASGGVGRTLWRGASRMGRGTFDPRNAPVIGRTLQASYGAPTARGGHADSVTAGIRRRETEANALQPTGGERAQAETRATERAQREFGTQLREATRVHQETTRAEREAFRTQQEADRVRQEMVTQEQRAAQELGHVVQRLEAFERSRQGGANFLTDTHGNTLSTQSAIAREEVERSRLQRARELAQARLRQAEESHLATQQRHRSAQETDQRAALQITNIENQQTRRTAELTAELSGAGLRQQYGNEITTQNWRRWWVPRVNREAAARIRRQQSPQDRIIDAIREMTPPPAPPQNPQPQGGGH